MEKQTAVDWLVNGLYEANYISKDSCIMSDFIDKAKQMEKQQLKFAYNDGAENMIEGKYKGMEDYYNEKYEKWLKD